MTTWPPPLSAPLLSTCTNLFDPPPEPEDPSGSGYWRSGEVRQAAVVVMWDEWTEALYGAAQSHADVDWSGLCARMQKALDLMSPQTAVLVEWYIADLLYYFDKYTVSDPRGLLPAVKAALKDKLAESVRFKESRDNAVLPVIKLKSTPPAVTSVAAPNPIPQYVPF